MTGKEKCEILRDIRRRIAEENDIEFLSAECTHEGECAGTCPKCDAEIRYLDMELNRKAAKGEEITLAGIFSEISENIIGDELDPDGGQLHRLAGILHPSVGEIEEADGTLMGDICSPFEKIGEDDVLF